MTSITVHNGQRTEFDFDSIVLNTDYSIFLHCVYDPYNHFDTEFEFLRDPRLDAKTLVILWHAVEMGHFDPVWMSRLDNIVAKAPYRLVYLTGSQHTPAVNEYIPHHFSLKFFPVFDIRAQDLLPTRWPVITNKSKKYSTF